MKTAPIPRSATQERPYRMVHVHAATSCGHQWSMRTIRPLEEIAKHSIECPLCPRKSNGRFQDRRIVILDDDRHCVKCNTRLAIANTEDTCGPCEEKIQRKAARNGTAKWRMHLSAQHLAVLSLLPCTLPALVVKVALKARQDPQDETWQHLRWVDVQQILHTAIRAGEVVQWNPDGGRPVYRLVGEAS